MFYLILGNKEKADKEINKIAGKIPILKMDAFNWDADLVRGKVGGMSLFGGDESVLVFNQISESEENFESLKGLVEGMSESSNKFILVESDLNKDEQKIFKKSGAEILELEEKKKESKWGQNIGSNPFAIADAVGKRSAKEAWIEYFRSRWNAESDPEEIHGRIIGKVRDILLAQKSTAEEVGMHPFVYRKAKMDFKNWQPEKLNEFYDTLVSIYHQSRMGGEELDIALEKELLKI